MKVRVYDKENNMYFKSQVFAKINAGWFEKQLVLVPSEDGGYLKFFDYLDKSEPTNCPVLINTITPDIPKEWITLKSPNSETQLADYVGLIDREVKFSEFIGYPWIIENKDTVVKLLNGEAITYKGSIFDNKISVSNDPEWNYIEIQNDIDYLMEKAHGFHDSVINGFNYTSGASVDSKCVMYPMAKFKKIVMLIESQCCKPIEMVFEGVVALNLRTPDDNYSADMFDASLFLKDAMIYFSDCYLEDIDLTYDGTWLTAYSLRWRFKEYA
ncbi:MAG: hypothetical protein LBL82_07490 [Oscillospiraceae bacterium]|jgi:hypothetical protein|nr:hypothetical protein [Oscillospiraceae bacterium]